MIDPEAEWEVKYLLKPEYRMEVWRGQAPSEQGANLFARTQLLEQGYQPSQVSHVETKRVS